MRRLSARVEVAFRSLRRPRGAALFSPRRGAHRPTMAPTCEVPISAGPVPAVAGWRAFILRFAATRLGSVVAALATLLAATGHAAARAAVPGGSAEGPSQA